MIFFLGTIGRESFCLSCFRTVKAYKPEKLEQAEDRHRKECPN